MPVLSARSALAIVTTADATAGAPHTQQSEQGGSILLTENKQALLASSLETVSVINDTAYTLFMLNYLMLSFIYTYTHINVYIKQGRERQKEKARFLRHEHDRLQGHTSG